MDPFRDIYVYVWPGACDIRGLSKMVGSFDIKVPPQDPTYINPSKITSKHCYQTHEAYSDNMPPMYISLDLVSPTTLQI